jgi:polyhydroxyalkanoate synthase
MTSVNDKPLAAAESLTQASQEMIDGLIRSLGAGHTPPAPEIVKSLAAGLVHDSSRLTEIQNRYYQRQLQLWLKLAGEPTVADAAAPAKPDRRFHAREWRELPFFDYLRQSYLLNSQWLMEIVDAAKLDAASKKKLQFFTRQFIDAMAPSNFPATNPEALKLAGESGGESLARGLQNLADDMAKGRISMTDESAFEVGRNLALTPGAVIFENEFLQLVQYRPATETVYQRPLLIVPPCINKYYILDLQPENSFVRYACEQGATVFLISWRNMSSEMGHATWDDYLEHGVLAALEDTRKICGAKIKINALGFCVGGTLLASALAVLRAKGSIPVSSLTLLTTMLDFSDTGDISVYVDDAYVEQIEQTYRTGGLMPGSQLASTFASLRANELIWHYVVNNYLKGKTPEAFDLLYWNSDGANLSGRMYAYYVRNMYLENKLKTPGQLSMCGVPVDLTRIQVPSYVLAAKEDHIVPWKTAYASARLLGGKPEFVLTASGHIAGVVNPASKNRRSFWTNTSMPEDAEQWLSTAHEQPGSWWRHWSAWLRGKSGERIAARAALGSATYPEIEAAPGRYVKMRGE